MGHDVQLPKLEKGDIIVVHDTGGYTMSMYSKYNSITPSAVYGYERMSNLVTHNVTTSEEMAGNYLSNTC